MRTWRVVEIISWAEAEANVEEAIKIKKAEEKASEAGHTSVAKVAWKNGEEKAVVKKEGVTMLLDLAEQGARESIESIESSAADLLEWCFK